MIKILNQKDNGDGTVTIEYSFSEEFKQLVKKYYKAKRVSKKMLNNTVIEGLQNYIKKEEL